MTDTNLTTQADAAARAEALLADVEAAAGPDETTVVHASAATSDPIVAFPTSDAAPSVSIDAAGVPHLTCPLTKKTKAHIGTAVAGVTVAGGFALTYLLPEDSVETTVVKVVVGVAGLVATWLGIVLPTNLPKKAPATLDGPRHASK